jgi:prepilin peptidase CpaA
VRKKGGVHIILWMHGLFIIFILIAFVIDIRYAKLPNKLTICGTLVGIMFHTGTQGLSGLTFSLLGAFTGFLILLILYLLGALGAGDVKLFAAIGAMMGVAYVIQTMIYAILFSGLIGLFLLLIKNQIKSTGYKLMGWLIAIVTHNKIETLREMKQHKNMKFPFMYAVLPGVAVTCYYSLF